MLLIKSEDEKRSLRVVERGVGVETQYRRKDKYLKVENTGGWIDVDTGTWDGRKDLLDAYGRGKRWVP